MYFYFYIVPPSIPYLIVGLCLIYADKKKSSSIFVIFCNDFKNENKNHKIIMTTTNYYW